MSTRQDRVLGTVVGGVVALAVAAAFLASTRATTTWDDTTPEGAVQGYLSAVLDGDTQRAAGYLSAESPCDIEDLDRVTVPDPARIDLVDTVVDEQSARVVVDLAPSDNGPLDTFPAETHTFRLTRSGQGWLLVGRPWPLYDCGGDSS